MYIAVTNASSLASHSPVASAEAESFEEVASVGRRIEDLGGEPRRPPAGRVRVDSLDQRRAGAPAPGVRVDVTPEKRHHAVSFHAREPRHVVVPFGDEHDHGGVVQTRSQRLVRERLSTIVAIRSGLSTYDARNDRSAASPPFGRRDRFEVFPEKTVK